MERSSSTIPQTHIFFVPNIKGLAQTVLTWEGKVFAAADADAAETDWKHEVTPEWGDLMSYPFSYLNSSLGFAGGKHCQKITIPIFRLVLQIIAIPELIS